MNYVVLNDKEYFKNISFEKGREVPLHGRERVDGIFGTITPEILEDLRNESRTGNGIFEEQWLCSNLGSRFVVIRIPQDLLYEESEEHLEEILGLFDPKEFWLEMGAISIENKENRFEYFIVAYNKNTMHFNIIFDEKFPEKKEDEILEYVCRKIEEKIL